MTRPDISMTNTEISAFLAAGRTLQVATIGSDGFPHLAPMWYIVENGNVVFRSFTKSQKIVNLQRNPNVTVLVEKGDSYETLQGVMIKAEARLIEDSALVLHVYAGLAVKYGMLGDVTEAPSTAAIEAVFGKHADKNTVVEIAPHTVISWDHTKLGNAY